MTVFISIINIIVVIAAILLILLVVAQTNKGSDIGLFAGSAEMVFGSHQLTALSRITVILAFFVMGGVFLEGYVKVTISKNSNFQEEQAKKGQVLSQVVSKNKETEPVVEKKSISSEKTNKHVYGAERKKTTNNQ